MEVGKISAIISDNKKIAKTVVKESYVLEKLDKYIKKEKIIESLKMVNLDEDYINKKSIDLSDSEYNKLLFVSSLLNKEKTIDLVYFERGLCSKEREYFKKLFKKLAKEHGINFNIYTNDFSFCLNLVDEYTIILNNENQTFTKDDIYDEEIFEYFQNHELIDFILKSRKFNHLKENYVDLKEIIKAIYREIKWDMF